MDKLQNDIKLLKDINLKIEDGIEISNDEEIRLLDLVGEFKDKSKEFVNSYFGDELNKSEKKVFTNFYDNVKNMGAILSKLKNKIEPTNEEVRDYFFNGKNVNKLLFTDTYRSVLEFIQVNLNLTVKAEIYADLKVYFDTGCFEEDLKENTFKESIDEFVEQPAKLFDLISKKSQERNIGVKIVKNKNSGVKTVAIKKDYLNKAGLAKSGYVDCVKITPNGLVISMATSDGTISYDKEKSQLTEHLAAIHYAIVNGDFKYYRKNGEDWSLHQVKSLDEILEVRFNMLTAARTKDSAKKYDELSNLNINKERFRFLSECMSQVIDSDSLPDLLKRKISLEGFACQGIDNSALINLETFNKAEINGLLDKKEEIFAALSSNNDLIKEHFESIGKYLLATIAIDIKNTDDYCKTIGEFVEAFGEILPSTQKNQLKVNYKKEIFLMLNSDTKEDIARRQLVENEKQYQLSMLFKDETAKINEEIFKLLPTLDEAMIESRVKRMLITEELIELQKKDKRFKQDKPVKVSDVYKLYIANNLDFASKLEHLYGYKNEALPSFKSPKKAKENDLAQKILNKNNIAILEEKNLKP